VSEGDRRRWEERWTARTGEPGPPESFLVRHASTLPPGPVLDVASGDGRNALHLAALGHEVTAVDIAPAALARLEAIAATRGLSITTRVADLDAPTSLDGLGPFTALAVILFKPSPLQWDHLLPHLQPGGRLLLCSFGLGQHRRHGFNAAFCLARPELEALLGDRLNLLFWESWSDDTNQLEGSLWKRR
jgi:SAM-dependent methyltransferase